MRRNLVAPIWLVWPALSAAQNSVSIYFRGFANDDNGPTVLTESGGTITGTKTFLADYYDIQYSTTSVAPGMVLFTGGFSNGVGPGGLAFRISVNGQFMTDAEIASSMLFSTTNPLSGWSSQFGFNVQGWQQVKKCTQTTTINSAAVNLLWSDCTTMNSISSATVYFRLTFSVPFYRPPTTTTAIPPKTTVVATTARLTTSTAVRTSSAQLPASTNAPTQSTSVKSTNAQMQSQSYSTFVTLSAPTGDHTSTQPPLSSGEAPAAPIAASTHVAASTSFATTTILVDNKVGVNANLPAGTALSDALVAAILAVTSVFGVVLGIVLHRTVSRWMDRRNGRSEDGDDSGGFNIDGDDGGPSKYGLEGGDATTISTIPGIFAPKSLEK